MPSSSLPSMERYRVEHEVDLTALDPADNAGFTDGKSAGKKRLKALNQELEGLQELLYAEHRHRVLIVLQAMDTGGKDGTIRHVFEGVNPQGVKVASFKRPSTVELAHDYLWRAHAVVPATGEITIFNRSHYEDVLVVRVHQLVEEAVWSRRFDHINAFEKLLTDEGTTILKFFLHISPEEQARRLQARIDTPHKQWKFAKGDLAERRLWGEYMKAYQAVLNRTSTPWARWYVIPSDRKWYRNLVISTIVVGALRALNMSYPPPEEGLEGLRVT